MAYQRSLKRAVFLHRGTAPGPWLQSTSSLVGPAFLPSYAVDKVFLY